MKAIESIHAAADPHWVGDGFLVRSAFSYDDSGRELSPFLLLDYGAPRRYGPSERRRGVGPHPHRGFETVTIAYQGEIEHRDSSGGGGVIGPGDVQWMTAGAGIVHEEFHSTAFASSGGTMEMVQLWVNLPARFKRAAPAYQALTKGAIPSVALAGGAGTASVIAGELNGTAGPARTFTPIDLWSVDLAARAAVELPLRAGWTSAILVLRGDVGVGHAAREGELAVFSRSGSGVAIEAGSDARLLVMSGEPIDEPIVGHGPFVMNTGAEILQAIDDYRSGRMGALAADRGS